MEEPVRLCESGADAVAVHNDPSPENGLWAKVRNLERAMYRDDGLIVGARFMRTAVMRSVGGFDETLVAGENYDLHNRLLTKGYTIARTLSGELHLGGPRSLGEIWAKNFYYGQNNNAPCPASSPARISSVNTGSWRVFPKLERICKATIPSFSTCCDALHEVCCMHCGGFVGIPNSL